MGLRGGMLGVMLIRAGLERENLMYITIDGETLEVESVHNNGYLPMLRTEGGDYYIAEDSEEAGRAARRYWADMAENDPAEFTYIVGESTLVAWALGQSAGPGSVGVNSLNEWLDLYLDIPEEQWAGCDGVERVARGPSYELLAELHMLTYHDSDTGWVAYRWN